MKKKRTFKIAYLILAWAIVVVLIAVAVTVSLIVTQGIIYDLITVIITFSSFVSASFFTFAVFNHNASVREQSEEIRRQTDAVNERNDLFRNLQFIASNYTIIDFVDHMYLYSEFDRYIQKAKDAKAFQFYLMENDVVKERVLKNFDDYLFLTVRIPIKIVEGRAVGKISLSKIKFEKENSTHIFVPTDGTETNVLILYNETDHRQEIVVNLIMKKTSLFYKVGEVNSFLNIKINLEMESLLGVIIAGAIELYFTNPEKIEKSGANRYKINSSQFEIIGKPRLIDQN